MKISGLIDKLNEIKEQYGDLFVFHELVDPEGYITVELLLSNEVYVRTDSTVTFLEISST